MTQPHHYVLAATHLTAVQRLALTHILDQGEDTTYTPAVDTWLLCSALEPTALREHLVRLFQGTQAGFLLLELREAFVAGGLLPEDAWVWLKRHGFDPCPAGLEG